MAYRKLESLNEKGYLILKDHEGPAPAPEEWTSLEYIDWKSGGDTNFAPLASAFGDLECHGFWDHGKADKDGMWTSNSELTPTIKAWVENVGANFGRVRVIQLNPSTEEEARRHIHQDDNNRLNPDGEGWVVRAWLELDAPEGSKFILRDEKDDAESEQLIPLYPGRQLIIDTERMWHVVHNPGPAPRHALIASFETSDALDAWVESQRV